MFCASKIKVGSGCFYLLQKHPKPYSILIHLRDLKLFMYPYNVLRLFHISEQDFVL